MREYNLNDVCENIDSQGVLGSGGILENIVKPVSSALDEKITAANANLAARVTTVSSLLSGAVVGASSSLNSRLTALSGALQSQINTMPSGGAQSGAIIKNQPFSTTVGGYTVELTSNGGFSVYGSGASVTMSGGSVAVSAFRGVNLTYENEDEGMVAHVAAGFGGVNIDYNDTDYETTLNIGGQGVTANGSAITQIESTVEDTSLELGLLTGGVKYVCSSALSALSIGSAAPGCNATIFFTVASGAIVTPPANVPYFGVTSYTPGSSYLMMVNDVAAVCNEAVIVPGV